MQRKDELENELATKSQMFEATINEWKERCTQLQGHNEEKAHSVLEKDNQISFLKGQVEHLNDAVQAKTLSIEQMGKKMESYEENLTKMKVC